MAIGFWLLALADWFWLANLRIYKALSKFELWQSNENKIQVSAKANSILYFLIGPKSNPIDFIVILKSISWKCSQTRFDKPLIHYETSLIHFVKLLIHFVVSMIHFVRSLIHYDRPMKHYDERVIHYDEPLIHYDEASSRIHRLFLQFPFYWFESLKDK